ncbi:MAG: hypothetical protein HFI86_02095 [Bacilli bacterium]|nr:hypothetical protein [Bacilli bacterium]
MTVKDLIIELKKYNEDSEIKIHLKKYSTSQDKIVDNTYEDITKITHEHHLDNTDSDLLGLEITIYED